MPNDIMEAMQDFFNDPADYIQASKETDNPLDEATVKNIFDQAKKDVKGVAAALSKDENFVALLDAVYKRKKSKTTRFKLGGLIAYMKCLKTGGSVDCNCKSKATR